MAKKMPGVMVFFDLKPALEKLSLSEKGRLLDAILDYGQDETSRPGFDSPVLEMLWTFVAPRIDADRERYREKCDKARENANKRWSPDSCERIPSNADDANSNNNSNSNSNSNSNNNSNSNYNPTTTPTPTTTQQQKQLHLQQQQQQEARTRQKLLKTLWKTPKMWITCLQAVQNLFLLVQNLSLPQLT